MRRVLLLLTIVTLALALVPGCQKNTTAPGDNNNGGNTGGTGQIGVPGDLALARTIAPILADGVSTATVFATVVDGRNRALAGVGVGFTTDHGTIEPTATTDQSGVARVTLTSAPSATDLTATVTAAAASDSTGLSAPAGAMVILSKQPLDDMLLQAAVRARNDAVAEGIAAAAADSYVSDQTQVKFLGVTLTVSADPGTIPGDGISQSRIRARVFETTTKVPVIGATVRFGTTAGAITGKVQTDATGTAEAVLTGAPTGAGAQVSAFYGNTLTQATTVSFSQVTLNLAVGSASLRADGTSTTEVVATLTNQTHNPVAGAPIVFSTTLGTVSSPVVTGDDGRAVALLTSAAQTGTATVTAAFGPGSPVNINVAFVNAPAPDQVLIGVDPTSLPADGASQATVTATVLDANGDPVADGTQVTFAVASGGGSMVGPVRRTTGGKAEAIYVAGTQAGYVSLSATAGPAQKTIQISLLRLEIGGLSLTSDKETVLADGLASAVLTATVTDLRGNPVAPGTVVQFTPSNGQIEDVKPTDATGKATARLRASRFVTGTSRITAGAGTFQQVVDVKFVSEAASQIVVVDVNQPRIGIVGSGTAETSQIVYELRDRNGIPVDADHAATVNFQVVPTTGTPDAVVDPASAVTNDLGRVVANVHAGIVAGAVELQAVSGALASKPIRIAIHGDLPDPAHFSISFEKLNVAGLVYDGLRDAVTARVADTYGNPVPDSTAVWYQSDFGIVQGSAFTDDHGEATVWAVTAGPHPDIPGGDGLVTITAQTVSKAGNAIYAAGKVMWSGPTILEITQPDPAAGFDVPNGGSMTITFRLHDANGNPLTGGTHIQVSANSGTLGGDTDVDLPDTQNAAYTTFHVTIADEATDKDEAHSATVQIKVDSQNGNATASITGVIH